MARDHFELQRKKRNKTEEQKQRKQQQTQSYSKVTTSQIPDIPQPSNKAIHLYVDDDTPIQIMGCLLHAHLVNIAKPGEFKKEATKALKLTRIDVVLHDFDESDKIFKMSNFAKIRTNVSTNKNTVIEAAPFENILMKKEKPQTTDTEQEQMDTIDEISGEDINLHIFIPEKQKEMELADTTDITATIVENKIK